MAGGTGGGDDIVAVDSKAGTGNGDYVILRGSDSDLEPAAQCCGCCCLAKGGSWWWWWLKVAFVSLFLAAAVGAFIFLCGPIIVSEVVIPTLDWETATFSKPVLGLLIFASIVLFPVLMLPSSPSMWIAGMTFGYGYGFLLIMAGTSIGMSLPFFVGSLFCHRIQRWLEKWPKKAAIVRLAGEGDWLHQFRAVTLLRISPFPYIVFNYAAVATNVKYGPYITGSLVGSVPDTFITIYSGRLLRSLADATTSGGFLTVEQVIFDVLSFSTALATSVAFTIYAKRALQSLQAEEGAQLDTSQV